jgi:hypothetical protein
VSGAVKKRQQQQQQHSKDAAAITTGSAATAIQKRTCSISDSGESIANDAISLTLDSKDAARLVSGAMKNRQQQQ